MGGNTNGSDLAARKENELGSGGCKWDTDLKVDAVVEVGGKRVIRAVDGEGTVSGGDGLAKAGFGVVNEGHDEVVVGSIGGWVLVEGCDDYGGSSMMKSGLREMVR